MKLGVSPAAAPTPTGIFNQKFEALFPPRWSPGLLGLLCSPPFVRFICANVGPQGLLVVRLPALLVPHSASLGPGTATRVLSAPLPISAPPTGLDECLFFIYLVSDFLAIRFSVSSGCARRRSVSTYPAILVLSRDLLFCRTVPSHVSGQYYLFLRRKRKRTKTCLAIFFLFRSFRVGNIKLKYAYTKYKLGKVLGKLFYRI